MIRPARAAAAGRRPHPLALAAGALLAAGCASAPVAESAGDAPARPPVTAPTQHAAGTLRQDDVTVSIRAGAVLVKLTPLAEAVTRLLAPDTRQRLQALATAHRPAAAAAVGEGVEPTLLLVSFFSNEPDASYRTDALDVTQLGRLHRPAAVLPVTPSFGAERLRAQETQLAIYVFDQPIDFDQPMTVRYDMHQSDEWNRIVPRLESERARLIRAESRIP